MMEGGELKDDLPTSRAVDGLGHRGRGNDV